MSDIHSMILQTIRSNAEESSEGVILTLKVENDPSENYLTIEGGDLVFKTPQAADHGKANAALVSWLSRTLKIPSSRIEVVYGVRGTVKRVLIMDVTLDTIEQKLLKAIKLA